MKTRYKIGEFNQPIEVRPGDELRLTVTNNDGTKQKVNEDIKISMTVTHWVMLYIPGVGFGGLFGTSDIGEKMSKIFAEPELVEPSDNLII